MIPESCDKNKIVPFRVASFKPCNLMGEGILYHTSRSDPLGRAMVELGQCARIYRYSGLSEGVIQIGENRVRASVRRVEKHEVLSRSKSTGMFQM